MSSKNVDKKMEGIEELKNYDLKTSHKLKRNDNSVEVLSLKEKLKKLWEENDWITGTTYYALDVCERQVWFWSRKIYPPQDNELLELGRVLHELAMIKMFPSKSDLEASCEINIDGRFVIDVTRGGFVLEMKKSDRRREASMLQLAFYVVYFWVMKDFYVIGKVKYLEDKCVDLVKPEDWIEKVLKATINIVKIAEKEVPPNTEVNKSICKKCAYFEFCWA